MEKKSLDYVRFYRLPDAEIIKTDTQHLIEEA